jgi:hypothetical protein
VGALLKSVETLSDPVAYLVVGGMLLMLGLRRNPRRSTD